MKTKTAAFLLALLLAVGVLVIYHEASADIVVACSTCQMCCDYYGGTLAYQDCWWWQGSLYCNFSCTNFLRGGGGGGTCDWYDPVYGMCQEPY